LRRVEKSISWTAPSIVSSSSSRKVFSRSSGRLSAKGDRPWRTRQNWGEQGEFGPSPGPGLSSWNNKRQSGITRSFHSSVSSSLRHRVTTVRDAREIYKRRTCTQRLRIHLRILPEKKSIYLSLSFSSPRSLFLFLSSSPSYLSS